MHELVEAKRDESPDVDDRERRFSLLDPVGTATITLVALWSVLWPEKEVADVPVVPGATV